MSEPRRAHLVIGSPRGEKSTSRSLGTYLMERLADRGWTTGATALVSASRSDPSFQELAEAVRVADIAVLAQPLYVDSLPSLVIAALERLAETGVGSGQPLVAIMNCGFPEVMHNDLAIQMCELFAAEAGFRWAGGLALGMGEAIAARPLRQVGGMVRCVIRALDLTAEALDRGDDVPEEAKALMRKPFLPAMVYLWMGNSGWKRQARANGVAERLFAQPYAD